MYERDQTCGDIVISDISLTAHAGQNSSGYGGAAIGTSGSAGSKTCGKITITNADITAYPGPSASAIGFGFTYGNGANNVIGDIAIANSTIQATLTQTWGYGAIVGGPGGGEGNYQMGEIRITTGDSNTTPQTYFGNCTPTEADVLVGFPGSSYNPTVTGPEIYWNGTLQSGNITR